MDFVILGFLMMKSLSQYDLLQALQKEVSPFYQASLGSIQSALKKLEGAGYITVTKGLVGGRKKNLYTITDSGIVAFKDLMMGDYQSHKYEAQVSTKLFFLGLLEERERMAVLEATIDFIEAELAQLLAGEAAYRQETYDPSVTRWVHYQLKTLSLGIHHYEQQLLWFQALLAEEEASYGKNI